MHTATYGKLESVTNLLWYNTVNIAGLITYLSSITICRGPEGTPFEGGVFVTELIFPTDYPLSPPKMKFTSEMFHPNGKSKNSRVYNRMIIPIMTTCIDILTLFVQIFSDIIILETLKAGNGPWGIRLFF